MKKTFLFTLALAGLLQAFGQDTIHYGNPWYMFTGNYPNAYCNHTTGEFSSAIPAKACQQYVAAPGEGNIVYGIAVTFNDSMTLDENFAFSVGLYRKTSSFFMTENIWQTEIAEFEQLDSAGLHTPIRMCRFQYILDSSEKGLTYCYEFYFNRPVHVTDTFYAGVLHDTPRCPTFPNPGWFGPTFGYDSTRSQSWWGEDIYGRMTHIDDYARNIDYRWGCVFPIVKYRCLAPKEGMPGAAGDDWVELLFDDDGEDHLYEITYARMEDMVDTNAGIRTTQPGNSLVASDLEPGRQYWYRVRRSCTLVTDSTTIVSWSPWSRGFLLPPHTLGVSQAEAAPGLEVRPNPASTVAEVTVEGGEACSVELVDMHGRTVMQRRAEGGSVVLDLAGLPPAVYTLRALTAHGCATRRLVVAR